MKRVAIRISNAYTVSGYQFQMGSTLITRLLKRPIDRPGGGIVRIPDPGSAVAVLLTRIDAGDEHGLMCHLADLQH